MGRAQKQQQQTNKEKKPKTQRNKTFTCSVRSTFTLDYTTRMDAEE